MPKHIDMLHYCSSIHNFLATFQTFAGEVETINTVNQPTSQNSQSIPYISQIVVNKDKGHPHGGMRWLSRDEISGSDLWLVFGIDLAFCKWLEKTVHEEKRAPA